MKALVVGGNGFIGSALVDELLECGWEVVVLDLYERRYDAMPVRVHFVRGDLTQSYLVREALLGIDVVFHLAWATIHEVSNQDPVADVQANLIPSIHLIEEAYRAGVRRFVYTSSGGTVYGPTRVSPIPESHPQNPVTGYGVTKLAVEKYLHMFHHLHGLEYAVFRPSVPYGPRQNPHGKQGAIAVFLYRIAHGLPITIWGDGSVVRDYFYVSDLANALVAGARQELGNCNIFNIGGVEGLSLLQLVALVEETVGRKAIVDFRPRREFDAPSIVLDTTAAAQILQWHPRILIADGLRRTWDWMAGAIE